ncbi:MAG: hypothetical protein LBP56_00180 [Odoribacteraceae bacterium]|jgi:hypothetical protein|nr:hypothetical protein [Odoribacteraceae bacterium]
MKKITLEDFKNFLGEAYRSYAENVKKEHVSLRSLSPEAPAEDHVEEFTLRTIPTQWISSPFIWGRTKEKHEFWCELDIKWKNYIFRGTTKSPRP